MLDRWVADVGDRSMGDERKATVSSDQRRPNDSGDDDALCCFNAAADRCNRRRWRHQEQTAPTSTGQAISLSVSFAVDIRLVRLVGLMLF